MSSPANTDIQPISDSPWFWAYLFCTGALIAMIVIGPKYTARQTQIEQNGQKRQVAAQLAVGETPSASPATRAPQSIVLWPLFIVLGTLLSFAWIKLLRDRAKQRSDSSVSRDALMHDIGQDGIDQATIN